MSAYVNSTPGQFLLNVIYDSSNAKSSMSFLCKNERAREALDLAHQEKSLDELVVRGQEVINTLVKRGLIEFSDDANPEYKITPNGRQMWQTYGLLVEAAELITNDKENARMTLAKSFTGPYAAIS